MPISVSFKTWPTLSGLPGYDPPCNEPAVFRHDQLENQGLIKVMSFYVWYGLADDGDNHWNSRRYFSLTWIQELNPNLLILQECRDDAHADFVRTGLPHLHFLGIHRQGSGDTAHEMAPLLFRQSAFEPLDTGCFQLSKTPEVPSSRSLGSSYPRTASWIQLACRVSRAALTYINTHFHTTSAATCQGAAPGLTRVMLPFAWRAIRCLPG